ILEDLDMALVLLKRRGHALIGTPVLVPAKELAFLSDLDAGVYLLGLKHVDIHPAVDQHVVDLRDASTVFEPQVMNDRPVGRALVLESDQIGRIPLAPDARLATTQILSCLSRLWAFPLCQPLRRFQLR